MDYIKLQFAKANNVAKIIASVYIVALIIDALVFRLISLNIIKYIGLSILLIFAIGYGLHSWLDYYENNIVMTDTPLSTFYDFRNFIDDYNGKTHMNYGQGADNYDAFEDAMDTFDNLFWDGSKFNKTIAKFKQDYENVSIDDDSHKEQSEIEAKATDYIYSVYNQVKHYVRTHNNHVFTIIKYGKALNKANLTHVLGGNVHKPEVLSNDTNNMLKTLKL